MTPPLKIMREVLADVWTQDLLDTRHGPGMHVRLDELGGGWWAVTAMRFAGDRLHVRTRAMKPWLANHTALCAELDHLVQTVCTQLEDTRCTVSDALIAGERRREPPRRVAMDLAVDDAEEVWAEFHATKPHITGAVPACPQCRAATWSMQPMVDAFVCNQCGYAISGPEAAHWKRTGSFPQPPEVPPWPSLPPS